jgi:ElaB/YqjD/DUF883 family membrane-anchored ribosome-binding protein
MTDVMETMPRERGALKEKAVAAKCAVADLAGEAKRYASERVGSVYGRTKTKASEINGKAVDYVQHHPYRALAAAAGIGFVVGLILKRR